MPGRVMPEVLQRLHELDFAYAGGEGIDFEPYLEFLNAEETRAWFRAWTGNDAVDGAEYRIFGQDGTGGYAAFWLTRPEQSVLSQPIVFFGSEGELGVVAADFSDYLWLLAGGAGPYEAVAYPGLERPDAAEFTAFAERHADTPRLSPADVVIKAQAEFPDFVAQVQGLCQ